MDDKDPRQGTYRQSHVRDERCDEWSTGQPPSAEGNQATSSHDITCSGWVGGNDDKEEEDDDDDDDEEEEEEEEEKNRG